MLVKIRVYDRVKYHAGAEKVAETCYEVERFEILNGKQINVESFGDDVDEHDEYLVLYLSNGESATFRNSYVDLFIEHNEPNGTTDKEVTTMMNFEKYRAVDTIQLVGLDAAVFQENENGELIDPICWKDANWISGKPVRARAEDFNFEEYVINSINDHFYPELKPLDIVICGNTLQFWIREDADGYCDEDGDYYVLYCVAIKINGMIIDDEDELASLLPSFEY